MSESTPFLPHELHMENITSKNLTVAGGTHDLVMRWIFSNKYKLISDWSFLSDQLGLICFTTETNSFKSFTLSTQNPQELSKLLSSNDCACPKSELHISFIIRKSEPHLYFIIKIPLVSFLCLLFPLVWSFREGHYTCTNIDSFENHVIHDTSGVGQKHWWMA